MQFRETGIKRNAEMQRYEKDELNEEIRELQLEQEEWAAAMEDPNSGIYQLPPGYTDGEM